MLPVFKLILFFIFFVSIAIAGYSSFRYLNNKISGSKTGWQLLGYAILLFLVHAALFFWGIFALIKSYDYLVNAE